MVSRVPANNMPEFGSYEYHGIRLEVNHGGTWEPYQLFFFDWLLDKEQTYWISSLDDIKNHEVLGKVKTGRNSDVIFWATHDMLRVAVA